MEKTYSVDFFGKGVQVVVCPSMIVLFFMSEEKGFPHVFIKSPGSLDDLDTYMAVSAPDSQAWVIFYSFILPYFLSYLLGDILKRQKNPPQAKSLQIKTVMSDSRKFCAKF